MHSLASSWERCRAKPRETKQVPGEDANLAAQRTAIERMHNCKATFRAVALVHETFGAATVWDGDVSVFDLAGHPTATTAYAWSDPVPGSDRRRFYAVLHAGPVDSPEKAVRAAIIGEYRKSKKG